MKRVGLDRVDEKVNNILFVEQVMNAAWDSCISVISENSLPCLDKVSYNHVLEKAKPLNDPDGRHYSAFTYRRLGPLLMEPHNIMEFERFVKRMHGKLQYTLLVRVHD